MQIPALIDVMIRALAERMREAERERGSSSSFMKTTKKDTIPAGVPRHWRHHYQKLQTLRDGLLTVPSGEVRDLRAIGFGGPAVAPEHQLTFGILLHEEDALYEVDAAMQRILDGSYGNCEETGKSIPESRLRVVPWTRFTKEALERLDRARMAGRADLGPFAAFQGAGALRS